MLGTNDRVDCLASQTGMPTVQLFHKITDSHLLVDTCHGDKICTTFTDSSTTGIPPFAASQASGNHVRTLPPAPR